MKKLFIIALGIGAVFCIIYVALLISFFSTLSSIV